MNTRRFREITKRFSDLRVAVAGDFCLDRYLEIDPKKREVSIETGLAVLNVVNIRAQPGAAGTVLNNLCALGIGRLYPVGFRGLDGEGMELEQAMERLPGVTLEHFISTHQRRTFTYAKPLLLRPGRAPTELNRLDFKNWSPTPQPVRRQIAAALRSIAGKVDAIIVLDQADLPGTGVITGEVLEALRGIARAHPRLFIIADSRRGLRAFPPLVFKMNAFELSRLVGSRRARALPALRKTARELAKRNRRTVFITLAERGMLGAAPSGEVEHVPTLPVRGPIDIVGAGDAVTASLTAAMTAGATLHEALELANAAASVVIHKLGTTGTASVPEVRGRLEIGTRSEE